MELLGASAPTHAIAKCLATARVQLAANCSLALAAPAAGGNFVPSLWVSPGAETYTYAQLRECPATGAPVALAKGSAAALAAAISAHVYGAGKPMTASLAFTAGKLAVAADSHTFTYAITQLEGIEASDFGQAGNLMVLADTAAAGLAPAQYAPSLTAACEAGRYGLILGDSLKLCPLAGAGSTADGSACQACAAGTAKAGVGAGSCAECAAGSYAPDGSSDCLPCPQHTYAGDSGAKQCDTW